MHQNNKHWKVIQSGFYFKTIFMLGAKRCEKKFFLQYKVKTKVKLIHEPLWPLSVILMATFSSSSFLCNV